MYTEKCERKGYHVVSFSVIHNSGVIAIARMSYSLISIRSRLFPSQAASPCIVEEGAGSSSLISRWLTLIIAFTSGSRFGGAGVVGASGDRPGGGVRINQAGATTCKRGIKSYTIESTGKPLKVERAIINDFLQLLHQIAAFMLDLSQAILLILRDQVWQGIAGITTLISLLLAIRSLSSEKSRQAEIDQLKLLLRKGVIDRTAPPKPQRQRQKAPSLGTVLLYQASARPFSPTFPAL
jgi:hypothetical protein